MVTGLGSPSHDAMATGDHDQNYYLLAPMGCAVTVGLCLAKAQPNNPNPGGRSRHETA